MTHDTTETIRRVMVEEENTRQDDDIEGQSWTTEQLQEDFTVSQFLAPFVLVRRKSDGVKGTLMFRHHPRLYYGFEVETKVENYGMKAKYVTTVTVTDPDSELPVDVGIYKEEGGGMFGVDNSYLELAVGPVVSPHGNGELEIEA